MTQSEWLNQLMRELNQTQNGKQPNLDEFIKLKQEQMRILKDKYKAPTIEDIIKQKYPGEIIDAEFEVIKNGD